MAYLHTDWRPIPAAAAQVLALFQAWLAGSRRRQRQRRALTHLLDLDDRLLADLGVSRADVLQAFSSDRAGATLAACRAANSRFWPVS